MCAHSLHRTLTDDFSKFIPYSHYHSTHNPFHTQPNTHTHTHTHADLSKSDGDLDPTDWMSNFPIPIEDPTDVLYEPPHRTRILSFPSRKDPVTGAGINSGTSFLDAHTIYGWNDETAQKLRTHSKGKLLLREDGHLPDSVPLGLPNQCGSGSQSAAGDPRVDENPILYSIHMVWLRGTHPYHTHD